MALLRAVDEGHRCVVEAEVWPAGRDVHPYAAERAGPYVFANPAEATRFVTQAVEALIALGCDVSAA
ncbi:MAG TPA: hypothetical protein VNJ46_04580 [Gaiellaceae bacterium]|nr:hypothetical protein [Gaiellaceae bacterium]